MKKKLLLLLTVFSLSTFVSAENFDLDELLEDDEGEMRAKLLWVQADATVVTASKKEEKIQEAPANITVITHKQIEAYGVSSLSEVLSFVPGITVMETYFGYTEIIFRGNFQEIYNNKSLLLINGHPSWEVINGSFNLEIVPIDSVKQIEIIRGPGSVLYGTNAYAGVINIITFSGKEMNGNKVSGKGGSFGQQEYRASSGNEIDSFSYAVSGTYSENDGYPMDIKRDEIGRSGSIDYENDIKNLFVDLSYKDFSLNYGYMEQDKQKFGFVPILLTNGLNNFELYYVDMKYSKPINENFNMQVNLRFDDMDKTYFMPGRAGEVSFEMAGYKQGAEVQMNYTVNPDLNFTFGGSFDSYKNDTPWTRKIVAGALATFMAWYNTDEDDSDEKALYLQTNYKPYEKINLVAGLRYNDNSRTGDDLSPSLGMVYQLTENGYFKMLYGEAYRSPNIFEQALKMPGVTYGDINLQPETIKTFDAGFDFLLNKKYSVKANYFILSTDDTIQRGSILPDGARSYINGDGQEVQGIEMEFNSNFTEKLNFFLNGAYKTGELKANHDEIPFLEKYTANTGLSWNFIKELTLTSNLQYIGKREDNNSPFEIDPYTLVNLQLIYNPLKKVRIENRELRINANP